MTNEEEVILVLKELKDWEGLPYCIEEPMQNEGIAVITKEALDMAIKALDIELLTDTEQRIFLSAMSRERTVCKTVDDMHTECSIGSNVSLVEVCDSIERKVKKIWE